MMESTLSVLSVLWKKLTLLGLLGVVRRVFEIGREEGWGALIGRARIRIRSGNNYRRWVDYYDTLTKDQLQGIARQIEGNAPLTITVLLPADGIETDSLMCIIEAVLEQVYPHWVLLVLLDMSDVSNRASVTEDYASRDARVILARRARAASSVTALSGVEDRVHSEWLLLLNPHVLLREHALYCLVEAVVHRTEIGFVYSDEDWLDRRSRRQSPCFKPDWNSDLFYAQNLVGSFGFYSTQVLEQIGWFSEIQDGAELYDLTLRAYEVLGEGGIAHIPRVLAHRLIRGTEVVDPLCPCCARPTKSETVALRAHFTRAGVDAEIRSDIYGRRIVYGLSALPPSVSLLIPTRNGLRLLRNCVDSLLVRTDYPRFEIIIVDNGSDEPDTLDYLDILRRDPRVRVIRDTRPFNYSRLNNMAVEHARGEFVGLLNNDIEVITRDWLSEMVGIATQPGVGVVGAKLLYPDGTVQHAGIILGYWDGAEHGHKGMPGDAPSYCGRAVLQQSFSAVTAACLIVRKSIYEDLGGLNEADLPVAFNDVDFCLRVKNAGYRNVWTPYALLYHHESATRGKEDTPEKKARADGELRYLRERWGEQLLVDPAYNPNLTLLDTDFSLAWPPRVSSL